jgi:hypothetical protein
VAKTVVGLEPGPLSLVSTTEELLDSGSYLENREYGRRDPSRWPRGTLYPQKLAITSPTSGGRSVSIVHSRTQTMELYLKYNTYSFMKLITNISLKCNSVCSWKKKPYMVGNWKCRTLLSAYLDMAIFNRIHIGPFVSPLTETKIVRFMWNLSGP